ncbi:MAG: lysophospholipase [Bacteroidota bacterium]|nr:lysophospholipase [Bacteroidota bacterium]
MKKNKISFTHKDGTVDGIYFNAGDHKPLVIIINGHNGFYNYGMFPYIQQTLAAQGISSYSFNFSHGGIKGDSDFFDDLTSYEKNCMRLEIEDVMCILHNLTSHKPGEATSVFLLAHSLGGVPEIYSAVKAQNENIVINGIILLSTVKQLNFWPHEMMEEWKQNKIFYKKNNRTKQLLPQGEEFLNEILKSDTEWNVEKEIKKLKMPILIVHGDDDEAIPVEHGQQLFEWIKNINKKSSLEIIPEATHTFNTRHPFEGPSLPLKKMLETVVTFIQNNQ